MCFRYRAWAVLVACVGAVATEPGSHSELELVIPAQRRHQSKRVLASVLETLRSTNEPEEPTSGKAALAKAGTEKPERMDELGLIVFRGNTSELLDNAAEPSLYPFFRAMEVFLSRVSGANGFGRIAVAKVEAKVEGARGGPIVMHNKFAGELVGKEWISTPWSGADDPMFGVHIYISVGLPSAEVLFARIQDKLPDSESAFWDEANPMITKLRERVVTVRGEPVPEAGWTDLISNSIADYLKADIAFFMMPFWWGGIALSFLGAVVYRHSLLKGKPKLIAPLQGGDHVPFPSTGLFECWGDPLGFLAALFCPCIRWGATLHLAGVGSFYLVVMAFAAAVLGQMVTMGLSLIIVTCLGVIYRNKLKKTVDPGAHGVVFQDVLMWFCCWACAIAQEARHMDLVLELEPMEHMAAPGQEDKDPHRPRISQIGRNPIFWNMVLAGLSALFSTFGQNECVFHHWFLLMGWVMTGIVSWDLWLVLSATWSEDIVIPMSGLNSKTRPESHTHSAMIALYKILHLVPFGLVVYGATLIFPFRETCMLALPGYFMLALGYVMTLVSEAYIWCQKPSYSAED